MSDGGGDATGTTCGGRVCLLRAPGRARVEPAVQLAEFASPDDRALALGWRPDHAPPTLAVGFRSGAVRLFDVAAVRTIRELRQHRGPVTWVAFRGSKMSSGAVSTLTSR